MKRLRIAAVAAALVLAAGAAPAQVARIVDLVNAFRDRQGLPALATDRRLAQAAAGYADYMARTDRYGHEADGREPSQRASAAGYEWCAVSENLAWFSSTQPIDLEALAANFVDGWEKSPGHRRNMADPEVVQTGVGVARSGTSGRWYAVQLFGRPKSMQRRFRIENGAGVELSYEVGGERYTLPPQTNRTHEECRSTTLTLQRPGAAPWVARPLDGDRWRVERVDGRIEIVSRR
jgi:hypothetical protein